VPKKKTEWTEITGPLLKHASTVYKAGKKRGLSAKQVLEQLKPCPTLPASALPASAPGKKREKKETAMPRKAKKSKKKFKKTGRTRWVSTGKKRATQCAKKLAMIQKRFGHLIKAARKEGRQNKKLAEIARVDAKWAETLKKEAAREASHGLSGMSFMAGDPRRKRRKAKGRRRKGRRDPSWFGQPRRHGKAAKKGWRGRHRDPSWFGQPRRHGKAAKKGWRGRRDPVWFEAMKATDHAAAGRKGWRKAKRKKPRAQPKNARKHERVWFARKRSGKKR